MLLAIDIGNSHTVVGLYDGDSLTQHFRLETSRTRTRDEYGVYFRSLLEDAGVGVDAIRAAIVASVVPPLTRVIRSMCVDRFGVEPLIVGPGVKTGMPVLTESPREVGADRIVNAVAGYQLYTDDDGVSRGLIIVDFGTATTFDVVSPEGEYLGGAIAPGVMIATEALFQNASKLPRVELAIPDSSIGRTTVASMQAGILYGYVALVDGLVARMRTELEFDPRVIATGGVAGVIASRSEQIEHVDDRLTLSGLRLIYERNQGSAR